MSISEDDVGKLFTTDGTDAWRVITYSKYPTAMLENLETGERRGAAVGSILLKDFKKLVPAKEEK